MRITLVLPSLTRGGAERQATLLAAELVRRSHDVAVVTLLPLGRGFEPEVAAAGVRLTSLDRGNWTSVIGYLPRLMRFLAAEKPEVVYSFLPQANVLAALAELGLGCPVVWSVRSADIPLAAYGLATRTAYALERRISKLPRGIVVNSRAGQKALARQGVPADRIRVISNGFDTVRFQPDAERRARVRATWRLAPHEIAIGLPARLDPVKDHATFLKAAAILRPHRGDVRFFCLGGGREPYASSLSALARELGLSDRLIWAGEVDDMPGALNALDIATLCSISEGFPNAVGEAMACGKPCVVTDVGDCSVLVGDAGLVVPAGDPDALAAAWTRLLEPDLGRALSEAARARLVGTFSVGRMVDSTLQFLVECSAVRQRG